MATNPNWREETERAISGAVERAEDDAAVPGREHVVIDGADHGMPCTHPRLLANAIVEFLRRHPCAEGAPTPAPP